MRADRSTGQHRGRGRLTALVVTLALAASACGHTSAPRALEVRSDVARRPAGASGSQLAVQATDELAAALYQRLAAPGGNVVFSPYSIEIALAMTRTGARGATRDQMDRVLGAPPGTALDASLNALALALASRSGTRGDPGHQGQVSLSTADQLWGQAGLRFEPAFLDQLAADYGAGMRPADFATGPNTARREINTWASDETHGRIKDLIPDGGLDGATRLVLANALYFKAPWLTEFSAPTPSAFVGSGGSTESVPTITGGGGGGYGEGPGWKAAELPYLGGDLSMVVIVPDDLARFDRTLDGNELAAITGHLDDPLESIAMPTFSFRQRFSLKSELSALGMPLAFSEAADFSGMTTSEALFLREVFHQAFISVDQHGTEAAAATAVVAETSAARAGASLVVDRPFVFAIRDRRTGAILFLGQVTDPASAS